MKKNEPIRHIMTPNVETATLLNKFSEVRKQIESNNIHHLPILDGKQIVGIISRVDILRFSFSQAFDTDTKSQDATLDSLTNLDGIMTKNVVTLHEDESVRAATELLVDNAFNSLPIVNDKQELVGIITSKDLMRYLLEQY